MSDSIGNMLTIIRNGYLARQKVVNIPYSKMKLELGKVLVRQNYLAECTLIDEKGKKNIRAVLRYVEKLPAVSKIMRISKPGRRIYSKYSEIKPVVGGKGLTIVSTPKGLLSDKEVKKLKLGGEVVCQVW